MRGLSRCTLEELLPIVMDHGLGCGLFLNRNELIAQLSGLTLDLIFQSLLPLGIASGPDGFVVFDLFGDDWVEDDGNFMSRRASGGFGPQFGFHATQIVPQRRGTAM